jgi:hypothetical protein
MNEVFLSADSRSFALTCHTIPYLSWGAFRSKALGRNYSTGTGLSDFLDLLLELEEVYILPNELFESTFSDSGMVFLLNKLDVFILYWSVSESSDFIKFLYKILFEIKLKGCIILSGFM